MVKLALGVLLWSITHFLPAIAVDMKKNLVSKMGENGWKGLFTVLMVLAIYLMVSGWKATIPVNLYVAPEWSRHLTSLLVLIGLILFFAPYPPTNLKRLLRHPQLTGVALWGFGHLLANGESRSIVLFGGLAAWAVIEMLLINRRDGARRTLPDPVPFRNDAIVAAIGIAAYAVLGVAHGWLFGVSPFI